MLWFCLDRTVVELFLNPPMHFPNVKDRSPILAFCDTAPPFSGPTPLSSPQSSQSMSQSKALSLHLSPVKLTFCPEEMVHHASGLVTQWKNEILFLETTLVCRGILI